MIIATGLGVWWYLKSKIVLPEVSPVATTPLIPEPEVPAPLPPDPVLILSNFRQSISTIPSLNYAWELNGQTGQGQFELNPTATSTSPLIPANLWTSQFTPETAENLPGGISAYRYAFTLAPTASSTNTSATGQIWLDTTSFKPKQIVLVNASSTLKLVILP